MTENRYFGPVTAAIDHDLRCVTLTLKPVKQPVFDVAKLKRWARESLAEYADYEFIEDFSTIVEISRPPRRNKIPLEALPNELPRLRRRK